MLGIDLDQHATRNQLGDGDFLLHTAADGRQVKFSCCSLTASPKQLTCRAKISGSTGRSNWSAPSVMLRRRISRWHVQAVREFAQDRSQTDDVTVLVLKVRALSI